MKAVVVMLAVVLVVVVVVVVAVHATIAGFNMRTLWALNGMTFLEELEKKCKLHGKTYSCNNC